MKYQLEDFAADFNRVSNQMVSDGLNIGLVGHLGEKTQPIAEFFSNLFNCDKVFIPSVTREGKNTTLSKLLNFIYPYFPESILGILAEHYKTIYEKKDRVPIGELMFDRASLNAGQSILLVDDNAYTGQTLEMSKERIRKHIDLPISTFTITVTGNYRPDYFCFEGWRSFKWRPIGM
jgi:hypothetical protein